MIAPWVEGNICDFVKADPHFSLKCPEIATDILAGRIQLLNLVESLGELLTNSDPLLRAQGTQVLSLTMKDLPTNFLSITELQFLVDFFCDRIKDHHEVLPSVFVGILAMCKMKNISKDAQPRLLNSIFLNVNCQAQRQPDRNTIYQILQVLTDAHLHDIRDMGPDLVFGIISAIDGERDPRNLMLLFSMLPNIIKSIPLGHLTEEFFEVVACYFPVDFKPSSDDPGSVTREDLALHLAACLTAIPQFAEFCLPLLLEKLNSSLLVAKLDSLFLLTQGCKVFMADDLAVHLSDLWMSLSREAMTNSQGEVREAARSAISSLLHNFSISPLDSSQQTNTIHQLLGYIVTATVSTLNEVETNLFSPSIQLLLTASKSCRPACETIMKKVVPVLCEHFLEKPTLSEKVILLQSLTMFFVTSLAMNVTPNATDDPELQLLWRTAVPLYLNAAQSENILLKKVSLCGLTSVAKLLNFDERQKLYGIMCAAVNSDENDPIRDDIECCLCCLATLYPDEALQSILFEKLTLKGISFSAFPELFKHRLSAQCQLAALESFTDHIIPGVLEIIITSDNLPAVLACVSSLRKLLKSLDKDGMNKEFVLNYLNKTCKAVSCLLKWWMTGVHSSAYPDIFLNASLLEETASFLRDVVRHLNPRDQLLLVYESTQYFPLNASQQSIDLSSPHVTQTVLLVEAVIGSLHKTVTIPSVCGLSSYLVNLAVQTQDANTHLSACRLIASLVNKHPEDAVLEQMLSDINSVLDSMLESSSRERGVQATSLLGWVTKGLLLRGFTNIQIWIDKLLLLLGDEREDIAMTAAEAFNIIMDQSSVYLTSRTHCTVKLLYRQRLFQSSAKLLNEYRKAPSGDRSCHLLALAHLLQGVPQTVLTNNFGEVLPLLLESLALKSTMLLLASLKTLQMLLDQPVHQDHLMSVIQTMIPRLLHLTVFQQSLKVRIGALGCLSLIARFPAQSLLPFKYEVVAHLSKCLDDPKRLVRKEAVKARTGWILLDAPGNKEK